MFVSQLMDSCCLSRSSFKLRSRIMTLQMLGSVVSFDVAAGDVADEAAAGACATDENEDDAPKIVPSDGRRGGSVGSKVV